LALNSPRTCLGKVSDQKKKERKEELFAERNLECGQMSSFFRCLSIERSMIKAKALLNFFLPDLALCFNVVARPRDGFRVY
jgi:hypothetical protein